jgi:sRNA-binding carbon storage regulator CsrA|tara:strand:+ start:41 stop:301 length:261 start_codon:yes stop_codon:yes gene_type:complete
MLLLQRHVNESVIIHNKQDPTDYVVVRVCDVYPTGDVTLGFIGDKQLWSFVRTEIFNQRTTLEESQDEENINKEKYYATQKNGYYG